MSEPAVGFVFIPIQPDEEDWKKHLVRRVFQALGGFQRVKEVHVLDTPVHPPNEQDIELIGSSKFGGNLVCPDFAGFWMVLAICRTRPGAAYQPLYLNVSSRSFSNIQGDPMRVEAFAAAFVQLCESLDAAAAYFSEARYTSPDELIDEGLNLLQREDIQGFFSQSGWRAYFHPQRIANWREKLDLRYEKWVEELPSGALVIADWRGYNPQLGDGDALPNARFLLAQVERRAEIAGAHVLLSMLRQEEKRLLRIEDDADYSKHREDAHYDSQSMREARAVLDEVRATWACALERPGLVGVQQPFSGAAGQEEIMVPIVADEGREWLLATLLHPFDLNSAEWNDPETGMQARVQRLLDAARQHPIKGEPPRVVIYFWRGVTPEVREALISLGAGIEVAGHLPILTS